MGMAASQARYLALVARKSNCEYEGQQINQARLALSNQSANLFNQMLGLKVPVPPSTNDYTKTQYSFSDGTNNATMDSWYQLAQADSEGYNYIVNYHYNANVYTGSQKKMNDPQVQFSGTVPPSSSWATQVELIKARQEAITGAQKDVENAEKALADANAKAAKLSTYCDKSTYYNNNVTGQYDEDTKTYRLYVNDTLVGDKYTAYDALTSDQKADLETYIAEFKTNGVEIDTEDVYYDPAQKIIAFKSDLEALKPHDSSASKPSGVSKNLAIYRLTGDAVEDKYNTLESVNKDIEQKQIELDQAKQKLADAKEALAEMSIPTYIGNIKLTPLETLTDAQATEIKQVISDMTKQDVNTTLDECFSHGTYTASDYIGGIYSFVLNGTTYYATYYDLATTVSEGKGINNIDDQPQLPYYNALYVSTRIDKQEKAILETDAQGRFTSIRLGNDTVKYTLKVETITDEAAYEDAMNQYYYENAKYDKMVQDINSKTSLIQQEDRTLELRLKQLDTEQNALSTEIDAVAKVVKDNVEKSFKTFSG